MFLCLYVENFAFFVLYTDYVFLSCFFFSLYIYIEFLKTYDKLGESIANYGGPEVGAVGSNDGKFGSALRATRAASKGSPVAPDSAIKIKSEGDVVLYSVIVLKGQHEAGGIEEGTGNVLEGKCIVDYIICNI